MNNFKLGLLAIVFTFSINGFTQNLVPNSGYENYSICPNAYAQIYYANGWFQPHKYFGSNSVNLSSSSDYFNGCSLPSSNVSEPLNINGFQNPHSGTGYVGIALYCPWFGGNAGREYVEVKLNQELVANKSYKLKYFVSMSNGSTFSITKFDAFFSNDSLLYTSNNFNLIPVAPQIQYNGRISDTLNWTEVSGDYISLGGERFLTLGNFHTENQSDTMRNNFGYLGNCCYAYYYYDDITLIEDTITGIDEIKNSNFEVYPNPTHNKLQIKSTQVNKQIRLLDLYGKTVYKIHPNNFSENIDVSKLENGVYFVECEFENGMKQRKKIVVQH